MSQQATTDAMRTDDVSVVAGPKLALWLLMLTALFSIMDRQVMSILAEHVRRDLDLSDAQLGMLTGLMFAMFYSTLALPLARLAEHRDRVWIISISLALWSAFTALCGLAATFAQLVVARLLVGVGEAGSGPASQSLIADLVPPAKRAAALGFVFAGAPLGTLIGMAGGGYLADTVGWRAAFVIAGLPGIVLAILLRCLVRDPRPVVAKAARSTFAVAAAELGSRRSFAWLIAGSALLSLTNVTFGAFAGSFFLRAHGAGLSALAEDSLRLFGAAPGPTGVLGALLGLALGFGGLVGAPLGGVVADRAARKGEHRYLGMAGLVAFVAGPFFLAAAFAPSVVHATLLLGCGATLSSAALAPVLAATQTIASQNARATAAAILFLITNLAALGLGPLAAGLLSDLLAERVGSAEGLRLALSVACVGAPIAAACFAVGMRRMAADLETLKS